MKKTLLYAGISTLVGVFIAKALLRPVENGFIYYSTGSAIEETASQEDILLPLLKNAKPSELVIRLPEPSHVTSLPHEESEYGRYSPVLENMISSKFNHAISLNGSLEASIARGDQFVSAFQTATVGTRFSQNFIRALAYVESTNDPCAYSPVGAQGLNQLRPIAVKAVTGNRSGSWAKNPVHNVLIGALYLERLHDRFLSLPLALAAYNAGPTVIERAVEQYGKKAQYELNGIPETTQDYIAKVFAFERLFSYRVFNHSQQISSDSGFSYTVKNGDTLSRIANRCGTSVKALLATNDVDPLKLMVGQKIWVRY